MDETVVRGVDYTPDIRRRICLIPHKSLVDIWEQDYKKDDVQSNSWTPSF